MTKDVTQDRDIAQYDQGGHFICCRATDETGIKIEEKTVRDFIWQHWVENKKGYIKLSYIGADNSNTTHYFIEPNENNEWTVNWKVISEHSLPEYTQPIKEGFGTIEKINSLKRKGDWELHFKPISGNRINNIPIF